MKSAFQNLTPDQVLGKAELPRIEGATVHTTAPTCGVCKKRMHIVDQDQGALHLELLYQCAVHTQQVRMLIECILE